VLRIRPQGPISLGIAGRWAPLFDLLAAGGGDPITAPGLVLFGSGFRIERVIAAPSSDTWTHYDISLDSPGGWTYRDAGGTRPAAWADLKRTSTIHILGSWWSGTASAALDNFSVELAR
jgi:hypothetical protein